MQALAARHFRPPATSCDLTLQAVVQALVGPSVFQQRTRHSAERKWP